MAWCSVRGSRGRSPACSRATLFPADFPDLTDRERDVLERLASGASNDTIARELFVSNETVRNTVSGIYAKLHASGRADAIVKAREAGFGQR